MPPGPADSAESENDPARDYDDVRVISARRRTCAQAEAPHPENRIMATAAQIAANRKNAQKSTGPRRTDRTRFNGGRGPVAAPKLEK